MSKAILVAFHDHSLKIITVKKISKNN